MPQWIIHQSQGYEALWLGWSQLLELFMLLLEFLVIQCSNQISKVKSQNSRWNYFEPIEVTNIWSTSICFLEILIQVTLIQFRTIQFTKKREYCETGSKFFFEHFKRGSKTTATVFTSKWIKCSVPLFVLYQHKYFLFLWPPNEIISDIFILGNMLLNYESDFLLKMIKFGFALSVVVGFPLMIYPCRQSIFTLFLQKSIKYTSLNDSDSTYIPPSGKCHLIVEIH